MCYSAQVVQTARKLKRQLGLRLDFHEAERLFFRRVRGFAAITDEPPAAVAAAGHDRCVINLKPEHLDAWLTPEGRTTQELQDILSNRAVSMFQHAALEAA